MEIHKLSYLHYLQNNNSLRNMDTLHSMKSLDNNIPLDMAPISMLNPRDNWPPADTVVHDHLRRPLFRTAPDSNNLLYMANSRRFDSRDF